MTETTLSYYFLSHFAPGNNLYLSAFDLGSVWFGTPLGATTTLGRSWSASHPFFAFARIPYYSIDFLHQLNLRAFATFPSRYPRQGGSPCVDISTAFNRFIIHSHFSALVGPVWKEDILGNLAT
jgi:hypothetical protein